MAISRRRVTLILHIATSVGWLGAVAAFLVLSVTGLNSEDPTLVRSAFVSMDVLGRYLIVPLSLAALGSGIFQSLTTPWGLFQQYWVVTKLVLTVGATALLLLHQYSAVAAAAALVLGSESATASAEINRLGRQLTLDAIVAIVVLVGTTVLSVLKPWGPIRFGKRVGARYALVALGAALLIVAIVHLASGGLGHHGP
jgi:hypothetical protein